MKPFLLFAVVASVVFASCGKDKFQTVPQVTIKSFGPDEVRKGQIFTLSAEITDKEGDLQDSIILVQKRFTGNVQIPARATDTIPISIAEFRFPNTSSIELQINFSYGEQVPGTFLYGIQENQDRGLVYGLIVQDKAKNKSTYVETRRIILKKV